MAEPSAGPLAGFKVVELGGLASAPYAGRLFADLGADVVKVEPPGGDESRQRGPFPNDEPHPERSGFFLAVNAGKFGVQLDLSVADDRKALLRLLGQADVLVENLGDGVLAPLGLAPEALHERFPALVIASVSPYGRTGPFAHYRGTELTSISMGGLANLTPFCERDGQNPPDTPPLKMPGQFAGLFAGMSAANAVLAALVARDATGEGQIVEIDEYHMVVTTISQHMTMFQDDGDVNSRIKRWNLQQSWYYVPCKDGYVGLCFMLEWQWRAFVKTMGEPEWAGLDIFADLQSRYLNWDALEPFIVEWTSQRTKAEIYHAAQRNRSPVSAAYTVQEAVESPQVVGRGFMVEVEHPEVGVRAYPTSGARFSTLRNRPVRPAPLLGQHNDEVLGHLSAEAVAR
jgi:crotonobetainyl-CoA:carnitine CoA-transferase CaiB-like acyl-CoA transferase